MNDKRNRNYTNLTIENGKSPTTAVVDLNRLRIEYSVPYMSI